MCVPGTYSRLKLFTSLLIAIHPAVRAQTSQGRISGLLADPQEAPVPNVAVAAINQETGVQTKAHSNQSGLYVVPFLTPGRYTITAETQGFKSYRRRGIQVQTGEELDLPIKLELGQVSETVTVAADAPVLQNRKPYFVAVEGLRHATASKSYQVTADVFGPYPFALENALSDRVSFAQLIKVYQASGW